MFLSLLTALALFSAGMMYGVISYRRSWLPFLLLRKLRARKQHRIEAPCNEEYLWTTEFIEDLSAPARVSMVGDSLTAMARWSNIFPTASIVNMAVGWDNTVGILSRIKSIKALSLERIFIMAGTNDLDVSNDVNAVFRRYEKIIDELSATSEIVVQSTLFVGRGKSSQRNARIAALNARLHAHCEGLDRARYIDLNRLLAPDGVLLPEFDLDGTHLKPAAYRVWAKAIEPLMLSAPEACKNYGV